MWYFFAPGFQSRALLCISEDLWQDLIQNSICYSLFLIASPYNDKTVRYMIASRMEI